uniref:HEAT repeat-containing protein 6 n=1 Tax=Glossina morsitans morsitans TaxID=37546 RepID=A0A1B0GBC3_GLOMM
MDNALIPQNAFSQLCRNQHNPIELVEIIKILDDIEKNGCNSKSEQYRIVSDFIDIVIISGGNYRNTGGIVQNIMECVNRLTHLQQLQLLPHFNGTQFAYMLHWILLQMQTRCLEDSSICIALVVCSRMFAIHLDECGSYFVKLFHTKNQGFSLYPYLCSNRDYRITISTVQFLNSILNGLKDVQLTKEQDELCVEIAKVLLRFFYFEEKFEAEHLSTYILYALQVLHKIVAFCKDFTAKHLSELLGISKACANFGTDAGLILPISQNIRMCQQALYHLVDENDLNINSEKTQASGGKTLKTHKPRAVAKNARPGDRNIALCSSQSPSTGKGMGVSESIRKSDSDFSESENIASKEFCERTQKSKIRLLAITLVGTVVRSVDRRIIFGFWHAVFPSGVSETRNDLLYIGRHDPNVRCRTAALQVSSQLLYGSKSFLHQAEFNPKRCPSTFIPFSTTLGFTLVAIYETLICILAVESSLPVLTQALKCTAVLVQATPLEHLENRLLKDMVCKVKPLVFHRDVAIQVSALMVMEFIIAIPKITFCIAEALGLPKKFIKLGHVNDTRIQVTVDEEVEGKEFAEFETTVRENIGNKLENNKVLQYSGKQKLRTNNMCKDKLWLLHRILDNLYKHNGIAAASVRIESLQVLIAMCGHFFLFSTHLSQICEALQESLHDILSDIRLYAARCIDSCVYQIGRHIEICGASQSVVQDFDHFWSRILPNIISHLRSDSNELPAIKVCLCDVLSNIGIVMFERFPHSTQINLVTFLSGISSDPTEDTIVRVASVRALAAYVLFPFLRNDLVFVENTANLTLHLAADSNLLVRIKAFWSLGNISDALIAKDSETKLPQEQISNELLYRLINESVNACSDNDKVRCNAVRTLGNLLRLLNEYHFIATNSHLNWHRLFAEAVAKLSDCIRSSSNAKVKWNSCYAVSNLVRNADVFSVTELKWQATLYSALCHVIVHHPNFKVRINATNAITSIKDRLHFGGYLEIFWIALLTAIEKSHNLDNYQEYNHRDSLQEQLCLAVAHIVRCSSNDDLPMLEKYLLQYLDTIRNTWVRVINRMVPEKAAPLLSCPIMLKQLLKHGNLNREQRSSVKTLLENLAM